MKVFLTTVSESLETLELLQARVRFSTKNLLILDPKEADLILILGTDATKPHLFLSNSLYLESPDRCAVYTTDDNYLPLLPGVQCSAEVDCNTRTGRIFNYAYITRTGFFINRFLSGSSTGIPNEMARAQRAKRYLFSFQGAPTSVVRRRLFALRFLRPDILIENTAAFRNWDLDQPNRTMFQQRYAETLRDSSFVLCPRGSGAGSIRFFECMAEGVAPVLLSDNYALPPDVDWDAFLLRCPEKDIAKLPEILTEQRESAQRRGELARLAFEKHFSTEVEFDRICELAIRSLRHGPPPEIDFRRRHGALVRRFRIVRTLRLIHRGAVQTKLKLAQLIRIRLLHRSAS